MLLKAMIITVQKTHLNEIYFLKNKIFQLKFKNLRSHDDETLIH
jgi:hypothetical protein